MRSEPIEITGITLLNKILEFKSNISDTKKWTLTDLQGDETNLVRFNQIHCLTKLFVPEVYSPNDLTTSIDNILNGDFINIREEKIYKNLFLKMDKVITKSFDFLDKYKEWELHDLCFNYRDLVEYKIKLNMLLNFNVGIMEISYPYCYSAIISGDISENIKYNKLDKFLSTVIDPDNRIFSRDQLIKDYNYPKEDVYDMELENF
jgi:hypothetical protein